MQNLSRITLAICAVLCALGGWFVVAKMNGSQPGLQTEGLVRVLPIILAVSGVVSAIIGGQGYMRAKSLKSITPLVLSLNLVLGALALMMALFFLLP